MKNIKCLGCLIESGKIDISRGLVLKGTHFTVSQDYEVPIPGFLILSSRRHFSSIAEFSDDEREEFIRLICKVRKGMKDVLRIEDVYLFQNEDSTHHFHVWMFPRLSWMEKFGRRIQSMRPIMQYAQENMRNEKNLKRVDDAVEKMRVYMKKF